ncbi:hypothetical protein ACIGFK_34105 [Streptomyces sp. NPDC085524]|uniref:hypothetical protein n=1 Tax=Streptomyces sp. NPDC085524 TaxID=3365728 RepID=UPI0037D31F47
MTATSTDDAAAGSQRRRALAAASLEASCLPGNREVVHDCAAEAYDLPGEHGRIVVSTGMLDALNARERHSLSSTAT